MPDEDTAHFEAVHEDVHHGEAAHEFHHNHFGGFLGASFNEDMDESAFTIGLEYARQFSRHWAVAGYVESVASDLERDVILALGIAYYPISRLALVVAPGIELATKTVEHHDEIETEDESEFMIRLGAVYLFPLSASASLGPAVFADHAGDRWTTVAGLSMVAGF